MICERIDADTLVRSLMYVNKQFYDIISDNYLWKKRVMRTFNDCNVPFMLTRSYNGEARRPSMCIGVENTFWCFLFVSISQKTHLIGSNLPGTQNWKTVVGANMRQKPLLLFLVELIFRKWMPFLWLK